MAFNVQYDWFTASNDFIVMFTSSHLRFRLLPFILYLSSFEYVLVLAILYCTGKCGIARVETYECHRLSSSVNWKLLKLLWRRCIHHFETVSGFPNMCICCVCACKLLIPKKPILDLQMLSFATSSLVFTVPKYFLSPSIAHSLSLSLCLCHSLPTIYLIFIAISGVHITYYSPIPKFKSSSVLPLCVVGQNVPMAQTNPYIPFLNVSASNVYMSVSFSGSLVMSKRQLCFFNRPILTPNIF